MTDNIIKFPIPKAYSHALKKVTDAVDELSDEDTDLLFSHLWAMGYGATSQAPTDKNKGGTND